MEPNIDPKLFTRSPRFLIAVFLIILEVHTGGKCDNRFTFLITKYPKYVAVGYLGTTTGAWRLNSFYSKKIGQGQLWTNWENWLIVCARSTRRLFLFVRL